MSYSVTKEIYFSYGHRLLNYEGPCQHLHGHNAKVEVELSSKELDSRGMVYDFSDINRVIKEWIDQTLDHTMLLRKDDPFVPIFTEKKEPFYAMPVNPTAEAIARMIFEFAKSKNFPVSCVTFWETNTSFATYRES